MPATAFDVTIFVVSLISYVVYAIYMRTLYKYRTKKPFNHSSFKILFHVGIFDMLIMTERHILYRFPSLGWLGMHRVVMTAPRIFAKIHVILFWYMAKTQVIGTVLLSVNRFWVISLNRTWSDRQITYFVLAVWFGALPFNVPLWLGEYHFTNVTDGVLLFFDDSNLLWHHAVRCFLLCALAVAMGGVCYGSIFVHHWRHRDNSRHMEASRNILFVGVVLTLLTAECGVACGTLAYGTDPEILAYILPWFDVGTELYCWINPYCLLVTCKALRKHMWATIKCSEVNGVQPSGAQ